jgi:hypothetical protein
MSAIRTAACILALNPDDALLPSGRSTVGWAIKEATNPAPAEQDGSLDDHIETCDAISPDPRQHCAALQTSLRPNSLSFHALASLKAALLYYHQRL